MQNLLTGLPLLGLSGAYLATWINPSCLGQDTAGELAILIGVEFVLVHGYGFMAKAALEGAVKVLIGMSLFYSLFLIGYCLIAKALWPVLPLVWMTLGKMTDTFNRKPGSQGSDALIRATIDTRWGCAIGAYILFAFLTVIIPLPELGLKNGDYNREFFRELGGEWGRNPEKPLAFGFLYFGTLGILELLGRMHTTAAAHLAKEERRTQWKTK